MAIKLSLLKKCQLCKHGECRCHMVRRFHEFNFRVPGDHPDNAIQPEYQKTWCEENNVDINVTDVAEKYCEFGDRYLIGGFTPDGKRWVPRMNYDEWRRATINYGLIKAKA